MGLNAARPRRLGSLPRAVAGAIAVGLLRILGSLPIAVIEILAAPLLPVYAFFRPRTRARLRNLPVTVSPRAYYRMRLRLAALSLKHLLGKPDGLRLRVEGAEFYAAALASGRPVVLLGWHQGPVELLHRVPPAEGRPFFTLTAEAFAAPLTRLMDRGRERDGKRVLHALQADALKNWKRERGVLAVMIDQVPGKHPEAWLSLWDGAVEIPFPQKLLDWLTDAGAVFVAVSVRLESPREAVFRYQAVEKTAGTEGFGGAALRPLVEAALSEAPEQYNGSYPKIRVRRGMPFWNGLTSM